MHVYHVFLKKAWEASPLIKFGQPDLQFYLHTYEPFFPKAMKNLVKSLPKNDFLL